MSLAKLRLSRAALGVLYRHSLSEWEKTVYNNCCWCTHNAARRELHGTVPTQLGSPLSDPENKGQRQTGINFDTVGSWNNRLNLKVNVEQSIKHGRLVPEIKVDSIGQVSLLGRREVNEDRWLACNLTPNVLLFGIFDGHGGCLAADYVCSHLKEHLCQQLEKSENEKEDFDLELIMKNAVLDLNAVFTKYLFNNYIGNDQAMASGTTATICLLRNDCQLAIAHVGDSRAIVCRKGKAQKLTEDHTPDLPNEVKRIKAKGGTIAWSSVGKPRVNGKLQMTRSIGDVELKAFGVTAEPETRSLSIKHSHDAFLTLCTDGIHNVLNSQEIVDLILSSQDPNEAARFVAEQAMLFGSEDNSTVIVVPFGAWGKFPSNNSLHFGFSRNLVGGRH